MRSRPRFRRARVTLRHARRPTCLRVSHLFTWDGGSEHFSRAADSALKECRIIMSQEPPLLYIGCKGHGEWAPLVPFHRFIQELLRIRNATAHRCLGRDAPVSAVRQLGAPANKCGFSAKLLGASADRLQQTDCARTVLLHSFMEGPKLSGTPKEKYRGWIWKPGDLARQDSWRGSPLWRLV